MGNRISEAEIKAFAAKYPDHADLLSPDAELPPQRPAPVDDDVADFETVRKVAAFARMIFIVVGIPIILFFCLISLPVTFFIALFLVIMSEKKR